ncbi:hypothetical protein GPALN_006160 [Globodera pallida]|nr:hypothetical protein GPALN_006160 [Globodera pallida]
MQSMKMLRELSAYSSGTRRSSRTVQCQAEDEPPKEEGQWENDQTADQIPIEVHIYPGTISERNSAEEEKEEEKHNEHDDAGDESEEEHESQAGSVEPPSAEQIQRWHRRRMFPNEVINDICGFVCFAEGNRLYTLNRLFVALLEPKRKLCLAVFLKRVEDTRQKLDQTIQEMNERRRHVAQLTEHIGTINARLADMGNHLANLDAQIVDNHSKLDDLQRRIAAMKAPTRNAGERENGGK